MQSAIPQDSSIECQVEAMGLPPAQGSHQQGQIERFHLNPGVVHEPLPAALGALGKLCKGGHIGFPGTEAQLPASNQGRDHPGEGFKMAQVAVLTVLTQITHQLRIKEGGV